MLCHACVLASVTGVTNWKAGCVAVRSHKPMKACSCSIIGQKPRNQTARIECEVSKQHTGFALLTSALIAAALPEEQINELRSEQGDFK